MEPATSWHAKAPSEVLDEVGSSLSGLAAHGAEQRRVRVGENRLEPTPPRPVWKMLVDQFRSVVVLLLAVAAAVAWIAGDPLDTAAIAVVLALNAAIGFASEWRARRAMEALLSLEVNQARVRRPAGGAGDAGAGGSGVDDAGAGWREVEVPAAELVPGDVVELSEGDGVPADLRLLEAVELTVIEAPLTGESVPVTKHPEAGLAMDTPLPERATMAWLGTSIASGRAVGVVVATGTRTEVGRIGTLVKGIADEETPLERRLDALGRRLAGAAFAVAGLVGWVGWMRGWAAHEMIETSLALAVAAVPEGLPAVATITLAIGLRRMARRNALIRRLPAVEALGAATVVCTDKTGTLTRGRMEVGAVWRPDMDAGDGGDLGEVLQDTTPEIVRAALLGTHAHVTFEGADAAGTSHSDPHSTWSATGDPTEAAVVAWALQMRERQAREAGSASPADAAASPERDLRTAWPLIAEAPFSSARRFAASLHRSADGSELLAIMRGAPEVVVALCGLSTQAQMHITEANERMAAEGLRVLALADRVGEGAEAGVEPGASGGHASVDWQPSPDGWRFLALIGLVDPPAEGVHETIEAFHNAGIETVMITGDQAATGRAIARALGMDEGRVHARVSPEEKLRLVEELQSGGAIVAMLGDGVNDAAALRKADVGVAMGKRGTSVAREMADVILLDDRFPTLAVAVREGRVIHDNIRKFVFYLFSCNLAEIFILLGAGIAGWALPLLPLQILWLNLVTDTFPALALAFEPADPKVMERCPRPPEAELLSRHGVGAIAFYAALITAVTLVAYIVPADVFAAGRLWASLDPQASPEALARARTLAFTTLALAQLFHIGNARGVGRPMWHPNDFVGNRWAIGAVLLGIALQGIALHLPAAQRVLGTVALSPLEWAWVGLLALVPAVVGQLLRSLRRRDRT